MKKRMTRPTLYKRTAVGKTQCWNIEAVENSDGTATIAVTQGLEDGKKQRYTKLVESGKNAGRKNSTTPYEQAVKEAEAEWRKKQERGQYGLDRDAKESAAKRDASPMLAQTYEKHKKKVDWGEAHAQPKLDGDRMIAVYEDDGSVTLKTRRGVLIDTLEHVQEELAGLIRKDGRIATGTTIDGEAYVHGMHVCNLRSLLTRKQPDCEKVSFRLYDVVADVPFIERHGVIEHLLYMNKDYEPRNGIARVRTLRVHNEDELMRFQRDCIADGFEGAMLRHGYSGYAAGQRSDSLLKVKTFEDAEFTIVGVVEGTGTYKGAAIFICTTRNGINFNVTAPGTIAEKREIWANRSKYIHKRLTVKFAGLTHTDQPVPFQPVATGIRDE